MATPTRDEVEMFRSITGSSEQQAVRKLEEYGGNLNLAVDAHFFEGIEQSQRENASSAVYPDITSRERHLPHVQQRGILPFLSAVRRFQPSSLLDADYRRNLLSQIGGSAFYNNSPVASNPSHTGATPPPSNVGSQSGLRPPLYAHNEAEAYSSNSYGTSAEEQMIQAAIEASLQEVPSVHGLLHRDSDREADELNHAIALSLMIAEQENAKHELQIKDKDKESESYASGKRTGNMNVMESSSHADGSSYSEGQAAERSSQNIYSEQLGFHASGSQEPQKTSPSKKPVLPEEPPLTGENTINLVIRMPDGSRHGCRFPKSGKLQSLFDFIDFGGWVEPGTYRLVIPYPRRALELANGSQSLSELGLNSKQEALYLELV